MATGHQSTKFWSLRPLIFNHFQRQERPFMWKATPDGVLLPIKLVPKSSRNEIVGWEGEELKVRINAVPEKGRANAELLKFLSKSLKIPKSHFALIQGETSRHKLILIKGIQALPL